MLAIQIRCPHCDHPQEYLYRGGATWRILHCKSGPNACGKSFVAEIEGSVTTYTLQPVDDIYQDELEKEEDWRDEIYQQRRPL